MSSPWASSVSHSATGLPCSQVLGCKGFLLQSPPPLSHLHLSSLLMTSHPVPTFTDPVTHKAYSSQCPSGQFTAEEYQTIQPWMKLQ